MSPSYFPIIDTYAIIFNVYKNGYLWDWDYRTRNNGVSIKMIYIQNIRIIVVK